jgi:hypothetical protein
MENRKLEATNSISINQLILGDSVESPEKGGALVIHRADEG